MTFDQQLQAIINAIAIPSGKEAQRPHHQGRQIIKDKLNTLLQAFKDQSKTEEAIVPELISYAMELVQSWRKTADVSADLVNMEKGSDASQFLALIAIPDVLNYFLQDTEALALIISKVNDIPATIITTTSYDKVKIFPFIFQLLWGEESSRKAGENVAVDFFMQLHIFNNLFFVARNSDPENNLRMVFQKNDAYFIEKMFENKKASHYKALFTSLTQCVNYDEALRRGVDRLFQQPDFNLADYYQDASNQFKALPAVEARVPSAKTMMEIARIFSSVETKESLEGWRPEIQDASAVMSALTNQYFAQFETLINTHEYPTAADAEVAYKRLKRLYEVIQQSGGTNALVTAVADDADKKMIVESACMKFQLKYRVEGYYHVINQRNDKEGKKGVKALVLNFILGHLDHLVSGEALKTYPLIEEPCFLWPIYEASRKNEGKKPLTNNSSHNKAKIKKWILETVLHSSGASKTALTLACLPDEVITRIFQGTGVSLDDVLKAAHMSNLSHEERIAILDAKNDKETSRSSLVSRSSFYTTTESQSVQAVEKRPSLFGFGSKK